ncbi:hypothetical protein H1D31_01435 [Alishewanella sp. BS5-314]|uniref:hypothetical protein n=1 Tax=Alishewanella sp. BS5-314 TaxID=2755587 RepID=UPI0021BAE3DC|nr:hypothetical protein [Alishewanella sp. BS5-314]MCT8124699.1 hypothetical protein [Alishewanella sp. BS5-314]
MERYKLIFDGQVKEGKDKQVIGVFLSKFLKISESNKDKLFSGRSYSLRNNLNQQQANELHAKLEQAGILTKVIREKSLQEDVTYQETVVNSAPSSVNHAIDDYRVTVSNKILCKHCGSLLQDGAVNTQLANTHPDPAKAIPVLQKIPDRQINDAVKPVELDSFNLSPWWKERFKLLQDSGAAEMGLKEYFVNGITKLPKTDSKKLTFQWFSMLIGLVIGPLLYLFKGMFRKGLFLTLLSTVISTIVAICLRYPQKFCI